VQTTMSSDVHTDAKTPLLGQNKHFLCLLCVHHVHLPIFALHRSSHVKLQKTPFCEGCNCLGRTRVAKYSDGWW
jgi:hypothetical protein